MNTYKKTTLATCALALSLIPNAFASMPNIEEIAKRQLDNAYQDIFATPFTPFRTEKNFKAWNDNMAELMTIAKNNSSGDAIIADTISKILIINANFLGGMKAGYALYAQKPNPSGLEQGKVMILFSNNRPKLTEAMNKLRKETYFLPGKKKAKDILMFILEKLERAHTTAENAVKG